MSKYKLIFDIKEHSDFLYKIKYITGMTDTVSMRSAELELEILSYFVSFFDAILQAGLLDTGYLTEPKNYRQTLHMR